MNLRLVATGILAAAALIASAAGLAQPPVTDNGVTTIHLDEHNGYFEARETLVDLKPGQYEFVVTNKAGKLVGFWLQDTETHDFLDRFPLQPGESRTIQVTITEHGFRYRCPINPTPWYGAAVTQ